MNNGITELAKMLKDRDNPKAYTPTFGIIISLPIVKIKISDLIILSSEHITSCINLLDTDKDGNYINIGKKVVLLPYNDYQKYIVIGVVIND